MKPVLFIAALLLNASFIVSCKNSSSEDPNILGKYSGATATYRAHN